jgi:GAF domain-containing protein
MLSPEGTVDGAHELAGIVEELKRELSEAHRRESATSQILEAISRSPSELRPVLDIIVETACRLCEAYDAVLLLSEGSNLRSAAHFGPIPVDFAEWSINRQWTAGRAFVDRAPIHVHDLTTAGDEFSDGHAMAVRLGHRTILSTPLLRRNEAIGVLVIRRTEVQPFSEKQVALLRTFADQAVIAIENARLFEEVRARTAELTEALKYQTATSEVLEVISSSSGEVKPVFQTMLENATRLCEANFGILYRYDGNVFHAVALQNVAPALADYLRREPPRPDLRNALGRLLRTKQPVHISDVAAEPAYAEGEPLRVAAVELGRTRTYLGVPMLKEGEVLGAIGVYRQEVRPFTDSQIELVTSFARQAVIAIENTRLFEEVQAQTRELSESLEHQTASGDVLDVISRSPNQVQPVFDVIVDTAKRLCSAERAVIWRLRDEKFELAAYTKMDPALTNYLKENPLPVGRASLAGRAVLERRTMHIADISGDPELGTQSQVLAGRLRTLLTVPLLREGQPIGVISLSRSEVRPFTDKQVQLVSTFADQAAIAIENARLFEEVQSRTNELQELLEYQTATSAVLSVISSSPTELQPVFDTIVENMVELGGGMSGFVYRFDGKLIHLVAHDRNVTPKTLAVFNEIYPLPPSRQSVIAQAILDRAVVHVRDFETDAGLAPASREMARATGHRSGLAVPMLRDGVPIGALFVGRRALGGAPHPFSDRDIELLKTFADQAVIAVNNVRLFEEVQARTMELSRSVAELKSLSEVSQVVNSSLDLSTVLDTILANACEMSEAGGGAVYVFDEAKGQFVLAAGYNMSDELIAAVRAHPQRHGDPVVGECAAKQAVVQVADLDQATAGHPLFDVLRKAGFKALLAVPLLVQNRAIGALLVRRRYPGAFSPEVISLLQTFASQSAIAVQNARLFQEIEEKSRQLELASRHKSQFLANMSHELRTPLNAILGYTELMQDGVYGAPTDKITGVLERVQSNGRHLLGLINDVLDLSKIEAGQLKLRLEDYSLDQAVETVVAATGSLAAEKSLVVKVDLIPGLPRGFGDERRIAQVLLNLVGNAIKFTEQGEVRISAGARNGKYLVCVSDTGPGIAAADQQRIFEEFHQVDSSNTKKKGGAGLGLAIAKRIVELHGGRMWVESAPGQGARFYVELPVRVEQSVGAS